MESWSYKSKAIILLLVLLIMNELFLRHSSLTLVTVERPTFSLLGPRDINRNNTSTEVSLSQLMDIETSFWENPAVCTNLNSNILLITMISSAPRNFINRKVIRNTWGFSDDTMKVVFLLGDSGKLNKKIQEESFKYGDIVQGSLADSYKSLAYKHVMGLKWVVHYCPEARYILKTDDDVFVNTPALKSFLVRELSPWGAKGLLACRKVVDTEVKRYGKSAVSPEQYPNQKYSPYCSGFIILYSQDVVRQLLKAAQLTPYFHIEDVFITSMVAKQIGVRITPMNRYYLPIRRIDAILQMGSQYPELFLFGSIEMRLRNIAMIWNAVKDK